MTSRHKLDETVKRRTHCRGAKQASGSSGLLRQAMFILSVGEQYNIKKKKKKTVGAISLKPILPPRQSSLIDHQY